MTISAERPTYALAEPDLVPGASVDNPNVSSWQTAQRTLAVAGVLLVAIRIRLPQELTVGDIFTLFLLPLWFPITRFYRHARLIMLVGVAAMAYGLILTAASSVDHDIRYGPMSTSLILVISLLAGMGFLLWAREQLGTATVAALFGLGLLIGINPNSNLYPSNPWKFGFSVGVTILALGLAHRSGKRWLELAIASTLAVVSALTDARSGFAIMLLTAMLMAWQLRPTARTRKGSTVRALLGVGAVLVSVYYIGQFLILQGAFGEVTRARTAAQLRETGSLIIGGRPELLATVNLMRDNPWGYGPGVMANFHDITVAKNGMAEIAYDPNNGYVENWMFGTGYSLHSMFGDLWAVFGIGGIVFTGLILILLIRRLTVTVTSGVASAVLIYLLVKTLWNIFFAPYYSGLTHLELMLALMLVRRPTPAPDPLSGDLISLGEQELRRLDHSAGRAAGS